MTGMVRVIDYYWHAAHGHRLVTGVPARWTYCTFGGNYPVWNTAQRPLPPNLAWTDKMRPSLGEEYDVCLLHMDQWMAYRLYRGRGVAFHVMAGNVLPQIVIQHGLPEDEENRSACIRMADGRTMVVNSTWAAQVWSMSGEDVRCITPGYRQEDWPTSDLHAGAICVVSGSSTARDHHGVALISRLKRDVELAWVGMDIQCRDFDEYRAVLGSSRVFVNPTQWSQFPGARSEAMMCGIPVVTTALTGEDQWLEDGVTAFLSNDYKDTLRTVNLLLKDKRKAREVGRRGQELAHSLFDPKRYAREWLDLMREVINDGEPA